MSNFQKPPKIRERLEDPSEYANDAYTCLYRSYFYINQGYIESFSQKGLPVMEYPDLYESADLVLKESKIYEISNIFSVEALEIDLGETLRVFSLDRRYWQFVVVDTANLSKIYAMLEVTDYQVYSNVKVDVLFNFQGDMKHAKWLIDYYLRLTDYTFSSEVWNHMNQLITKNAPFNFKILKSHLNVAYRILPLPFEEIICYEKENPRIIRSFNQIVEDSLQPFMNKEGIISFEGRPISLDTCIEERVKIIREDAIQQEDMIEGIIQKAINEQNESLEKCKRIEYIAGPIHSPVYDSKDLNLGRVSVCRKCGDSKYFLEIIMNKSQHRCASCNNNTFT